MSKRASREGSVYQRKDGRWVAALPFKDGKPGQSFYGSSQQAAIANRDKEERARADGFTSRDGRVTVATFASAYLESVKPNIRPATYSQYEFIIRLHILPVIGRLKLESVKASHVQGIIAASRRAGHSPTTSRHVHKVTRLLFERGVDWEMIPRNPAAKVDAPRAAKRDIVMLSPEQVTEFCHAAEGTRFESLFLLALSTGARVSELLAIRWESVDWDARLLTISHSLRIVKGDAKLDEPKTRGSVRRVALPPQVIASLKRHRASQAEQALKMGKIYSNPLDLIFTMELGGRVDRRNLLRNYFRPLLREAGLPTTLVMHDLRHQFTTTALANGLPVTLVAQALGHNSPVTLLRTYAHVLPTTQHQVANVFAGVLPDSGFDSNAAG